MHTMVARLINSSKHEHLRNGSASTLHIIWVNTRDYMFRSYHVIADAYSEIGGLALVRLFMGMYIQTQ